MATKKKKIVAKKECPTCGYQKLELHGGECPLCKPCEQCSETIKNCVCKEGE